MANQSTLAIRWHFLFGSGCSCSFFKAQSHDTEKKQASLQSLLAISEKSSYSTNREPVPPHHTHTHTHTHPSTQAGLQPIPCEAA
jgi:hypothetical protein